MSRKLTIKELAAALSMSVPTLRKYGECGLLQTDSSLGRTHLYDESVAVDRIAEINRLKNCGFSLASIRDKINGHSNGHARLNLGLDGPELSLNRHVLAVVDCIEEFDAMARSYVGHGLRAGQAVAFLVRPEYRHTYGSMLHADGFDVGELERRGQLIFTWYRRGLFDPVRQIEAFDRLLAGVVDAGWPIIRCLGHPDVKPESVSEAEQTLFEDRVHELAARYPASFVCSWLAPNHTAQTLLQMQRNHREIVIGDSTLIHT